MSLLRRIEWANMPRAGEHVEIYQHHRLIAIGVVVVADKHIISVAGGKGLVDLDTVELRRGLHDGSITIKRKQDD